MNVRKISCLGGGDLGVMLSVAFAVKCPEIRVTFVDPDPKNIFKWNSKLMPEGNNDPGLFDLLRKVQNKNLFFTTNEVDSIREAEILYVVLNSEVKDLGEGKGCLMSLSSLVDTAQVIVDHSDTDKVVVACSCIPRKTAEYLKEFIRYNAKPNTSVQVLSSPVFFDRKLGLKSVFFPDRVMIGHDESGESYLAKQIVGNIYERWIKPTQIVMKSILVVELAQIATYVLLAQKIASLCTLKAICNKAGRPIKKFALQLQKDSKVGGLPDPSANIGQFCIAIKNLTYICQDYNLTETIDYWKEVLKFFAFEEMYNLELMIRKIPASDLRITLFGFAQEDTLFPDLSLKICSLCLNQNGTLQIYDPKVSQKLVNNTLEPLKDDHSKAQLRVKVVVVDDPYEAAEGSHLLVIHSYREAWLEIDYKNVFEKMKKPAYLFDHFHLLQEKEIASIGFQVHEFFPAF